MKIAMAAVGVGAMNRKCRKQTNASVSGGLLEMVGNCYVGFPGLSWACKYCKKGPESAA